MAIAQALLDAGADPNAATAQGKSTPLHRAPSAAMYELLVKRGADEGRVDADGRTPRDIFNSR